MRIVIMGTGPFAVPAAHKLVEIGHEIPLVVTRPLVDPHAKKLPPRPVYDWAIQNEFRVFEPASINEPSAIEVLASLKPDLFFVCDYGQILSNACLAASRHGGINLHGSLLPRHRGAAPVQWALLRGDATAGVTVIHMTPRLDAGPALAIASTLILEDETAESLEPRLAELGVAPTLAAVKELSEWDGVDAIGEIQDKSLVTKAPRFAKSDGALDFRLTADYLVRLVRACQPWPGTFAELVWPSGKKIRIIVRAARHCQSLPSKLIGQPLGTAVAVDADELEATNHAKWEAPWKRMLAVCTADGVFLAGRVQPAGKREMDAEELLRGHPIDATAQFVLPDPPASRLE